MKKFLVLVKKEIKELITPQLILPLIVMVIAFSFIGNIMSKETEKARAPQPVWVVSEETNEKTDELLNILEEANFKTTFFNEPVKTVIEKAKLENIGAVIVVPKEFSGKLAAGEPGRLEIYNVITNFSLLSQMKTKTAVAAVKALSAKYSEKLLRKNNIEKPIEDIKDPVRYDDVVIIGERQAKVPLGQVMTLIQKQTTFIPVILFIVIMVAAQMVAVAVANEKENKTFETLLSLPINRKTIVFAKLLGAGVVALLFASVYMIGLHFYLKGMTGDLLTVESAQVSAALEALGVNLGAGSFILLGVSLFLGILVALAIAMILGVFVDNVKSIQAVITPLMIMVLLPYMLVLLVDLNQVSLIFKYAVYAIPFTHPFLAAQKIITHEYLFIIYGIIYQLIVFMIFVFIAAKIFSSDKILTLKLGWRNKKQGV